MQDAVPHLQKGSSVVIISSIAGFNPPPSLAMYGVTKTALLGLTKVGTWLAIVPSKDYKLILCFFFLSNLLIIYDVYWVGPGC